MTQEIENCFFNMLEEIETLRAEVIHLIAENAHLRDITDSNSIEKEKEKKSSD
jgi:regulator of replication initiation timing